MFIENHNGEIYELCNVREDGDDVYLLLESANMKGSHSQVYICGDDDLIAITKDHFDINVLTMHACAWLEKLSDRILFTWAKDA